MSRRDLIVACFVLFLAAIPPLFAQQGGVGSIVGQVRQARGDLSGRIFVELQLRWATIASAYTDDQGKFGFNGLGSNPYHVVIREERFYPVDQLVVLDTTISTLSFAHITLTAREAAKKDPLPEREPGSNPSMIDPSEYRRRFPKSAIREFDRGVEADKTDKKQDAIRHYEKAVQMAPEFYPAHNNLGSEYLSLSDFTDARREFEEVVRLNRSDAAAYFNLSNVCMVTGKLAEAQQYLEEGMRREPDSALGHFLLGSLEIKTGKLPEAETSLRQTIQLSPTMVQARLQLVNLFLQEGKRSEAVDQLREFVKVFPDSSFTPRARLLLQKLNVPAQTSAPR
jgi:tetratricopeptide (TPR) repeat protein